MSSAKDISDPSSSAAPPRTWIARLAMTDFRNYGSAVISTGPEPVVLSGANGAGKTNCLEALSLLTAGRGLRSLPFSELSRNGGTGGWAIAAEVWQDRQTFTIGTGMQSRADIAPTGRTPRVVKIDGALAKSSGALAVVRILWLTPSMDSLFTGPASERRRFMDRLALSLDPAYATAASNFDRAMRQRNKALEMPASARLLVALEAQMAEAAAQIACARQNAVRLLSKEISDERDRNPQSPFPWGSLALKGQLEARAETESVTQLAEAYADQLVRNRETDRAAGRTLVGPHRSDLDVAHGPKSIAAKMCSTGEQKAILVGLVLAQARLIKTVSGGISPLVLLDEIAAHLDLDRRLALFSAIAGLDAQVWMTGTDAGLFAPLQDVCRAQFFIVANASFATANDAESGSKH